MYRLFKPVLLGALIGLVPGAVFADGAAMVNSECASCHAIEQPAEATPARGLAPPLYFSGNKFRRTWLVQWLQAPERIRPAGYNPALHTLSTAEGDVVDQASLVAHVSVDENKAVEIADYLMSLQPFTDQLNDVAYSPGTISWRMGQLNFGKFNGCDSCHRDAPDYGGVSAPELYTAWDRLQPAFIASVIKDPTQWQADTLMPDTDLNDGVVSKLANYLKVTAEDDTE